MSRRLAAALASLVILAIGKEAEAQTAFVSLEGGPLLPFGDWADNLSHPDQTQFGVGPGGKLALGWAPRDTRYFTVGLEVAHGQPGTHAWESFTARTSSRAQAGARLWTVMAGGTVSLPGRGWSQMAAELHGALGVLVPSGEEQWRGTTTDYDFLRSTVAARVGSRAVWRLEEFDVWLGLDVLVAPGALRPTEPLPSAEAPIARNPVRRTLAVIEPGFGLRYWFMP